MIWLINVTIHIIPVNAKSNTYIDFTKENNEKDPQLKNDGIVGIPK